jgi:hypothetical protein
MGDPVDAVEAVGEAQLVEGMAERQVGALHGFPDVRVILPAAAAVSPFASGRC